MKVKPFILFFILVLCFGCEKRAVPPESSQMEIPSHFRVASGFHSITLFWTPVDNKNIAGYKIYYGEASKSYTDTISISREVTEKTITDLKVDQAYFCVISSVDINNKESDRSDEISIHTYLAYEDFAQQDGPLDTMKWFYKIGYHTPVSDGKVSAAEIQFNDARVMRSFGQYLKFTPTDNFVVESDFQLGIPYVGGAGLMIRSEKANPEIYYKGYNAFIFWNFNNWELRLEESLVDKIAMPHASPIKLPEIKANEWVRLSLMFKNGEIQATLFRLSDYSILGRIASTDQNLGKRPIDSDVFCGFFTIQYGGNIIYTDNFGIRRVD